MFIISLTPVLISSSHLCLDLNRLALLIYLINSSTPSIVYPIRSVRPTYRIILKLLHKAKAIRLFSKQHKYVQLNFKYNRVI